uniref:Uncharacterized protein n=1 Tax=Prolemur simus TaxID=1328070 RepID=A0A8C8YDX7_PROSS
MEDGHIAPGAQAGPGAAGGRAPGPGLLVCEASREFAASDSARLRAARCFPPIRLSPARPELHPAGLRAVEAREGGARPICLPERSRGSWRKQIIC